MVKCKDTFGRTKIKLFYIPHESEVFFITGIYMIRNLINDKKYIGQAHDIKYRWMHHKCDLNGNIHHNKHLQGAWNKYGFNNFEFSVIEEVADADLNNREIYWIEYYDSFRNGYNLDMGGSGTHGYKHPEDVLLKMRRVQNPDIVLQFDLDFNLIKQWDGGISHINKELHYTKECIFLRCAHTIKEMSPYKNSYWVFKDEYDNCNFSWDNYLKNISLYHGKQKKENNRRKIYQYSYKKELIKTWDSLLDVRKEFGNTSSISAVLYHRRGKKSAYGFIWAFENYDFSDGYFDELIARKNRVDKPKVRIANNIRKIAKIDPITFEELKVYNSMTEAAIELGSINALSRLCTSAQTFPKHKCHGFLWKYIE